MTIFSFCSYHQVCVCVSALLSGDLWLRWRLPLFWPLQLKLLARLDAAVSQGKANRTHFLIRMQSYLSLAVSQRGDCDLMDPVAFV